MKRSRNLLVLLLMGLLAMAGCTPRHVIVDELRKPVAGIAVCTIGDISDGLPAEIDVSDRPTQEDIQMFGDRIIEALVKEKLLQQSPPGPDTGIYQISGTIMDYKKGSGFLRFMFGAWAGGSKVTTNLKLMDARTKDVLFSGNFIGAVTSWSEKGNKMYEYVAKDFARELKKQNKKLLEAKK
jgi:hypothetical protein